MPQDILVAVNTGAEVSPETLDATIHQLGALADTCDATNVDSCYVRAFIEVLKALRTSGHILLSVNKLPRERVMQYDNRSN